MYNSWRVEECHFKIICAKINIRNPQAFPTSPGRWCLSKELAECKQVLRNFVYQIMTPFLMKSDVFVESSIKLMNKLWSGLFEYWVVLSFSRILKRNAVCNYLKKLKWLSAGLWLAGLWQDEFDCVRLGFLDELPLSLNWITAWHVREHGISGL